MYIEGRWEENQHTIEGKSVHRRVDRIDQLLPESKAEGRDQKNADCEEADDPPPRKSLARFLLGSEELGLMGKLEPRLRRSRRGRSSPGGNQKITGPK